MTRLVLIALAVLFSFAASQSVMIESCASADCGSSCLNCANATDITNTDSTNDLVVCPQNGTFCFIDTLFDDGTSGVQNCTNCNDTNSSDCTGCVNVVDSFSQDFCSSDGNCWSINFTSGSATNGSATNGSATNGSTTNTSTTNITTNCNCTDPSTGLVGTTGVDSNGNSCMCASAVANTTSNSNGTSITVNSTNVNATGSVTSFGTSLQAVFAIVIALLGSALLI